MPVRPVHRQRKSPRPGRDIGTFQSAGGQVLMPQLYPPGFNVEGFLRQAKVSFQRLQAANDAGDINDIRDYTTPELYAEIAMQIQERGGAKQRVDVLKLDAELLEVVTEGDREIASVHFSGLDPRRGKCRSRTVRRSVARGQGCQRSERSLDHRGHSGKRALEACKRAATRAKRQRAILTLAVPIRAPTNESKPVPASPALPRVWVPDRRTFAGRVWMPAPRRFFKISRSFSAHTRITRSSTSMCG